MDGDAVTLDHGSITAWEDRMHAAPPFHRFRWCCLIPFPLSQCWETPGQRVHRVDLGSESEGSARGHL